MKSDTLHRVVPKLPSKLTSSELEDLKSHENYYLLNNGCNDTKLSSMRVVGGKEAKLFEFPWM